MNPDQHLHGREIARRTGLEAGAVARELSRLVNAGLLKSEKRGNQVLYGADRDSPIFDELASILRKTSGLADVLARALEPVRSRIEVAFVFGSVAKGKAGSSSDIDLIVIGDVPFRDAVRLLHPAQNDLRREINPKVYSRREWAALMAEKGAFVRDVLAHPKVFVIGSRRDLAQPARPQSRNRRV
jgi:predicted nucleotidyltransferase